MQDPNQRPVRRRELIEDDGDSSGLSSKFNIASIAIPVIVSVVISLIAVYALFNPMDKASKTEIAEQLEDSTTNMTKIVTDKLIPFNTLKSDITNANTKQINDALSNLPSTQSINEAKSLAQQAQSNIESVKAQINSLQNDSKRLTEDSTGLLSKYEALKTQYTTLETKSNSLSDEITKLKADISNNNSTIDDDDDNDDSDAISGDYDKYLTITYIKESDKINNGLNVYDSTLTTQDTKDVDFTIKIENKSEYDLSDISIEGVIYCSSCKKEMADGYPILTDGSQTSVSTTYYVYDEPDWDEDSGDLEFFIDSERSVGGASYKDNELSIDAGDYIKLKPHAVFLLSEDESSTSKDYTFKVKVTDISYDVDD